MGTALGEGCSPRVMCGRIMQASGPLRLAMVDGLDVRGSGLTNVPRRYNAARAKSFWSSGKTIRPARTLAGFPEMGTDPVLVPRPKRPLQTN